MDTATDNRIEAHVCIAAGGPEAASTFPFARRHLEELARHRKQPPATVGTAARLVFLRQAWLVIDAAMASLAEIRFDVRQRENHPFSHNSLARQALAD